MTDNKPKMSEKNKKKTSSHRNLFGRTDKKPQLFWLARVSSSDERKRLYQAILTYGGKISPNPNKDAIFLIDCKYFDADLPSSKPYYSTDFIVDSITLKQRLNLSDYRLSDTSVAIHDIPLSSSQHASGDDKSQEHYLSSFCKNNASSGKNIQTTSSSSHSPFAKVANPAKLVIQTLEKLTHYPTIVIIHALFVCSGSAILAYEYLLTGPSHDDTIWSPEEDDILMFSDNITLVDRIIDCRGPVAIRKRLDFLDP